MQFSWAKLSLKYNAAQLFLTVWLFKWAANTKSPQFEDHDLRKAYCKNKVYFQPQMGWNSRANSQSFFYPLSHLHFSISRSKYDRNNISFCLNNETNLFSANFIWDNICNAYCVIEFLILAGEWWKWQKMHTRKTKGDITQEQNISIMFTHFSLILSFQL